MKKRKENLENLKFRFTSNLDPGRVKGKSQVKLRLKLSLLGSGLSLGHVGHLFIFLFLVVFFVPD